MSMDMDKLAQRVAALEKRFVAESKDEDKSDEKKEASERQAIASEIEALESKLASSDGQPRTAADEEDDEEAEDKTASLVDPNGIEEDITQKRHHNRLLLFL